RRASPLCCGRMTFGAVYVGVEWAIRVIMTPIVARRRQPPTALAWLSVIFAFPVFGLVAYLLIGGYRLGRRRVRRRAKALAGLRRTDPLKMLRGHLSEPATVDELPRVRKLAVRLVGMPIVDGNSVEVLTDDQNTSDRAIADIDAARHHAH